MMARKRKDTPKSIAVKRWDQADPPTIETLRDRLRAEGYKPKLWCDPPGTYYPRHEHTFEEVRWVVTGSMTFRFWPDGAEEDEIVAAAGDRVEIPAYVSHSATTSADMNTTYLFAYGQE